MRTLLFLLLSWALSQSDAAAQTLATGPWRVIQRAYKLTTSSWGGVEEWGIQDSSAQQSIKTTPVTAVRVRREAIQVPWTVHPASITLFLDCQNPLTISPRQLAAIRFKALGATVRPDAKHHVLWLVPSAPVVVVWAYRGKQLVFRHAFTTVPPPLPTVKCYLGGCIEANDAPPGEKRLLRTLTLRAIPDPYFAAILPEDARYRVNRFRTTLLRQGQVVELAPGQPAAKTVQGPQGDMSDLAGVAQPGDQFQTDVLLVQRNNYRNMITAVALEKRFITDGPVCPEE